MKFRDKTDLLKASHILAKFWGVKPADLLSFVAGTNKDKAKRWNKIVNEVHSFYKMDLTSRAKKLGITKK